MTLALLARNMRNSPTEAEYKLWYHLSRRQLGGLKFRRQARIENYIVDFLCFEKRLIIELDGGQHNESGNIQRDKERSEFLETRGFLVLRFWNKDIFENMEGVLKTILHTANIPLPEGGDKGEGS